MTDSNDLAVRKASLSDERRALLLKRLRGKQKDTEPVGIPKQSYSAPLPLSHTQQRVWFLQQLYPDTSAYNMSEAWRVKGPLDISALEQALFNISQRHGSLRTGFVEDGDGNPAQLIAPKIEIKASVYDISHLAEDLRESELQKLILQEGNITFSLQNPPLFRVSVIRLGIMDQALLVTFHHIITDEWSNDIFWRELKSAYVAALAGEQTDFQELPIHYADYAVWQREQVKAGALESQMNFWQERLGGKLPLLQLPSDHPRSVVDSLRGGLLKRELSHELLEELQSLSLAEGATLYMTLLAAYQVLLYRYSGQEDILVGTPIANRQRPETKGVMGMFINTAVIRGDLSGNPSFRQLLDQVRQRILEALDNQDLPFDLLVQAMQPERDLNFNPIFQSMFVYIAEDEARLLPGLDFKRIEIDYGVSKFDLTLFAGEEDGVLLSALEFSSNLFEPQTASRILDHWQALLEAIVVNPDAPIDTLSLFAPGEQGLLLEMGKGNSLPLTDSRCLQELISEIAVQNPGKTAVITEHERLTYGELNRRAGQLAYVLMQHGIQPGTPVALFVERSTDMVTGILGILKAGGAYVPLEPTYPPDRIAFALTDTDAPVIVTQPHLVERLPSGESAIIALDETLWHADGQAIDSSRRDVSLNDPAYIIFTSGSTGAPKGVVVTHRNLLASTQARDAYYEAPVGGYLLLSSFAFDSSVAGIFWTLAGGGALVLPEPDGEKDVHRLATIIAREKVTHTLALPSLYRLLLSYAPANTLESLKVVIVAGEACPPDLGRLHYRHLPQASLYNEYGPTEATVWCTVYRLPSDIRDRSVPIGRPIPGSQVYILDSAQQPVPIGVPGELYVGGLGVTAGYMNNPQLTAERFLKLNLKDIPANGRVYRTGDLVRWLADGQIEFLGRVDDQVKIRGYRIEPGEIEKVLLQHSAVQDCVVLALPGGQGERLAAFIVSNSDMSHNEDDLRRLVQAQLPGFMVPEIFVSMEELPRTPNGKVDRQAILAMDLSYQPHLAGNDRVVPRTPAEEQLAAIWADVLELEQVGVTDKFFELGGDSIQAIRVVSRARQEGLALTPRQLFAEQTIERLATDLETSANDGVLVPYRTQGSLLPAFWVPGVLGESPGLEEFVSYFDEERPFYGFRSIGLLPGCEPDKSMEEMAARYVATIRQVQPKGPYILMGFCYGGVVAYEMAYQLEEAGEQIGFLGIFEGYAAARFRDNVSFLHPQRWRTIIRSLPSWARGYKEFGGWQFRNRLRRFWIERKNTQSQKRTYFLVPEDELEPLDDPDQLAAASRSEVHRKQIEINKELLMSYSQNPIEGRVTLFQARIARLHTLYKPYDPTYGWGNLARGGVDIRVIDGSHITLASGGEQDYEKLVNEIQSAMYESGV